MKITTKETQKIVSTIIFMTGGVLIAFGIRDWISHLSINPIITGVIILVVGAYLFKLNQK